MSFNKPVRRIAIVGTGVIGGSWAAQYLARGFDVIATDPATNAEANLRKYVEEAWPALTDIGLSPTDRLFSACAGSPREDARQRDGVAMHGSATFSNAG